MEAQRSGEKVLTRRDALGAHGSLRTRRAGLGWLIVLLALGFLLAGPDRANAKQIHVPSPLTIGTPCASVACGNGELTAPSAVAINEESGNAYVVDQGNNRVQIFDGNSGTYIGQFNGGGISEFEGTLTSGAAAPTGAFSEPTWIAIDNDPASPSFEDVYVSDNGHSVIDKFSPTGSYLGQITTGEGGNPLGHIYGLATDPAGKVFVYQESREIDRYGNEATNVFAASCTDPRGGAAPGLAVDSGDNLYVNTPNKRFAKLDSSCNELIFQFGQAPEQSSAAVVDFADDSLYTEQLTSIARFPATSEQPETVLPSDTFGSGHLTEGAGLAVDSGSPEKLVYVADKGAGEVRVFKEAILPDVRTQAATEVKARSALLHGEVDPASGGEVSSCRFAWGTTAALTEAPVPCATPTIPDGSGFVAVSATLPTEPNTTYYFRLEAENANGSNEGEASETQHFTTPGPAEVLTTSATEVSGDSATLNAQIRLHGVPTSYRFEWGPTSSYGSSVPVPDGSLGSGSGEAEPSQPIGGLEPATSYHFRVVTRAEVEPGVFEEALGPDSTFTTQPAAAATALLDSRQWQLVSPPDKLGALIAGPGATNGLVQAAADGSAISYVANAPTELSAQGSPSPVQILSTRGLDGWTTRDIPSPHTRRATGRGATSYPEYTVFSQDLSAALIQPQGLFESSLSAEATEQTPFIRTFGGCTSGCYRPLLTGANALPGFGEERLCEEDSGGIRRVETQCGALFVGASPDLRHVVLLSNQPLLPGAGRRQLYEWSDGSLKQVSLLPPNGSGEELPAPEGSNEGVLIEPAAHFGAGLLNGGIAAVGAVKRAISADGTRVVWEVQEPGASPTLYVRDTERGETLQLDAAEAACLATARCESGGGRFQIASADGSRVLFTGSHRLTEDGSPEGDLYECRLVVEAGKLACRLSDLTPEIGGEIPGTRVQESVLGASQDLSTVYFVALKALATGPNQRGESPMERQPNLYLRRDGTTSFVATLSEGDSRNWIGRDEFQPARVSNDGRYLAFMSERSLTGYDNRDAVSGKPDAEVYVYDARTAALSCVSCNPSGARPRGMEFGQLSSTTLGGQTGIWQGSGWVAALLPASPSFVLRGSAYQTRSLTDSGRVFFNAIDALAPSDQNNQWDVYESEPSGVGECRAGTPAYQPASGSCLGLISSGASGSQSAFLDASETGADAFFLTASRLEPLRDLDSALDVYDAHECLGAGATNCFPAPEPPPPACAGDACQQPATPPNDQTPGSLTFSGTGNLKQCPKGKKLKQGKCVKRKAKKHKKKHHKKKAKGKKQNSRKSGAKKRGGEH